jgi:hypothetical protein
MDNAHTKCDAKLAMPESTIRTIASYLPARALRGLGCASRYLRATTQSVVPDLRPELPLRLHQHETLLWMRGREAGMHIQHPRFLPIPVRYPSRCTSSTSSAGLGSRPGHRRAAAERRAACRGAWPLRPSL